MVPGLVLFKVKQGSRKKEQTYGFYIQIKNILTTFPQKISNFDPNFLTFFMRKWYSTDFYSFGRFIHKLYHTSLMFSSLIEMKLQLHPHFRGNFCILKVFFSLRSCNLLKKEQNLYFKELTEHFWGWSVLYRTLKDKERL